MEIYEVVVIRGAKTNLGDYSNREDRIQLSARLSDGETADEVIGKLDAIIAGHLLKNLGSVEQPKEEPVVVPVSPVAPAVAEAWAKEAPAPVVEQPKEEPLPAEDDTISDDEIMKRAAAAAKVIGAATINALVKQAGVARVRDLPPAMRPGFLAAISVKE